MTTTIGYAIAGFIGVGIILIGLRFFLQPVAAATAFGVPVHTGDAGDGAYLSVKGVRDVASGLFIWILLLAGQAHLLAAVMLAATIIPVIDGVIVLRHHGPKSAAYGYHWGTAALAVVSAVLLLV